MIDFPPYFLDLFNNRLFMGVIAAIHVVINHPFAVGGYPVILLMEWWAHKTNNKDLDQLAYKTTFVFFVVTTTLGALTGVGIWIISSLIAPFGIGTLLRVFFWAWFIEWIVFITEVVLILIYFLTWKKWSEGANKIKHMYFGLALSVFSFITMALIVAILGYMMDPGTWNGMFMEQTSIFSGFFNPIYLPQLAFRTAFAMMTGGILVWFLIPFFTKNNIELRKKVVRLISIWVMVFIPFVIVAGLWYWDVVPVVMKTNLNVGLLSQKFMQWQDKFLLIIAYTVATFGAIAAIGCWKPRAIPSVLLIIPFILSVWLLGHFERVREFIRKPYLIGGYMYSNGVRADELPVYQRDGILPYATYVKHNKVTSQNMVEAGEDVFMIACSRCHTTNGLNGVINKFNNMYGADKEWDELPMMSFIKTMHTSRTYMPPFPGNDAELEALVKYILDLRKTGKLIPGAQETGITGRVQLQEVDLTQ